MKTIILYGHQSAAQEAFVQVDALLRERQVRDIALVQTIHVDQPTAHALREAGGELWYCGPTLQPPDAAWSPMCADRYLVGRTFEGRTQQVMAAFKEFMNKTRVAL